ncbi:hypothetical protein EMIT079MI2_190034 [Bacillus sp. IT-79MI2]
MLSFAVASAEGNINLICGFEMKSRSIPPLVMLTKGGFYV